MREIAKKLAYWLLPAVAYDALKGYNYRSLSYFFQNRQLFRRNRRLLNLHPGKRCFILCNGPSVNQQDLLPLKNETVLSVSSGYLHKDYSLIRPQFHCVPQVNCGLISKADIVAWFREMDGKLGDAELFLSGAEFQLVQDHGLFQTRKINYICLGGRFNASDSSLIDICSVVPQVMTVPIMCLMVAMYMGFKDIYLIGTEHDTHVSREYKYAFEPTILRGKDFSVTADGESRLSMYDELTGILGILGQYRHVKRIAQANGVNIWNATAGGMLEEFARVDLAETLKRNER